MENRERITLYRHYPVLAAKRLLGVDLTWWQCDMVNKAWHYPYCFWCCARGLGKTWVGAVLLSLRALLYSNERVGIVSKSLRQAKLCFNEIVRIINARDKDNRYKAPEFINAIRRGPSERPSECFIELENGSSIVALPLGDEGETLRGTRFHFLFLDELAQIPEDIIDAVLLPMLNVRKNPLGEYIGEPSVQLGNRLLLATTAFYQYNHAYRKFLFYKQQASRPGSKYAFCDYNINHARTVRGYIDEDAIAYQEARDSPTKFLMENMNVWKADSDGFFSASAIEGCKSNDFSFEYQGETGGHYIIAADPASVSADFGLILLKLGEPCKIVNMASIFDNPDKAIQVIRKWNHYFNVVSIVIDQAGGGLWVRDQLAREEHGFIDGKYAIYPALLDIEKREHYLLPGEHKVKLIRLQHPIVDDINWKLKGWLEHQNLLIPYARVIGVDDKLEYQNEIVDMLIDQLVAIQTFPISGGGMRFDTPSKSMKKDLYSALCLAIYEASNYVYLQRRALGPRPVGFWL